MTKLGDIRTGTCAGAGLQKAKKGLKEQEEGCGNPWSVTTLQRKLLVCSIMGSANTSRLDRRVLTGNDGAMQHSRTHVDAKRREPASTCLDYLSDTASDLFLAVPRLVSFFARNPCCAFSPSSQASKSRPGLPKKMYSNSSLARSGFDFRTVIAINCTMFLLIQLGLHFVTWAPFGQNRFVAQDTLDFAPESSNATILISRLDVEQDSSGGTYAAMSSPPSSAKGTRYPVRLLFSPHFDDGVLSLGGLLAQKPENMTVITVFGMETLDDLESGCDETCMQIKKTLDTQSKIALDELKVNSMNMKYADGGYWPKHQSQDTGHSGAGDLSGYRAAMRGALNADIKSMLEKYIEQGESVDVYCPLGELASEDEDHHVLHNALMDVASSLPADADVEFIFYEEFPDILSLFDKEFFPHDLNAHWFLEHLKTSNLPMTASVEVLEQSDFDKKMAAVAKFDSRVEATTWQALLKIAPKFFAWRCPPHLRRDGIYCEMTWKLDRVALAASRGEKL